jgi:glyoxylase-like metal-dependent hydrolase (beta-lactamase superfamily II)
MANMYFVGDPLGQRPWLLIDAGMPGFAHTIRRTAERLFGRPPAAVLLTHGHFDHVGSLAGLLARWRVPVYAHRFEFPFLDGRRAYPPPDPTVGGLLARLSFLYPRGPYNFGNALESLPSDGSVPGLPEWQWHFTPGHSPGHVSLYWPTRRLLVTGDAIITTRQESALSVLLQRREVQKPPAYYTTDWVRARQSVHVLAALEPAVLATGHGRVMSGPRMREQLRRLDREFIAFMPRHGRYVPDRRRVALGTT